MAFKDYIDKDTRNFLLILAGLAIFMFLIFPRIESQIFTLDFSQPLRPLFPELGSPVVIEKQNIIKLDPNKDYKVKVNTTAGEFTIDLDEANAPDNVANFITLVPQYRNSPVLVSKDYLFKIDSPTTINYTVDDEINADYLLLDRIKVRDAKFLQNAYDPKDSSTNVFEPNNLRKYDDFTVKQFYEEILGYSYKSNLATDRAVKYTVYMASTGPNQNKIDFFILMGNTAPEIDGRYTPIGRVTEGFKTLDTINNAAQGEVTVNSITVK